MKNNKFDFMMLGGGIVGRKIRIPQIQTFIAISVNPEYQIVKLFEWE